MGEPASIFVHTFFVKNRFVTTEEASRNGDVDGVMTLHSIVNHGENRNAIFVYMTCTCTILSFHP